MLRGRQARLIALQSEYPRKVVLQSSHRPLKDLYQAFCQCTLLRGEGVDRCIKRVHSLRDSRILARELLAGILVRVTKVLLRLLADFLDEICASVYVRKAQGGTAHARMTADVSLR